MRSARHGSSLLVVAAALVACAGPTAEGTYDVTSTAVTGSCASGATVTWTFRRLDDGAAYALEVAGVDGGCKLSVVDGDEARLAKVCRITLSDALVAGNPTASLDYDLTFDDAGFEGTIGVDFPPAASAPAGCQGVNRVVGKRR